MPNDTPATVKPSFTTNIRLDDGSTTMQDGTEMVEDHPWFKGTERVLKALLKRPISETSIVDLGCLNGAYATGFARLGYNVCGIEVRQSNFDACQYVKSKTDLPNLEFVKDDVRNISKYGSFDVSFCSGLLYHLDKPAEFLQTVADQTKSILVLQTHFAPNQTAPKKTKSKGVLGFSKRREVPEVLNYNLSPLTENEGFQGRWFNEPGSKDDDSHWASWGNSKSFWLTRPSLMQVLQNVGFDLVFEQFDNLTPTIAESMESGFYAENYRSTFIAVKVP